MARSPIHLLIGAPRSGTTWLFSNLKHQPGVFTPIAKEVRYWNGGPPRERVVQMCGPLREEALALPDAAEQAAWLDRWSLIDGRSPRDGAEYLDLMQAQGRPSMDISPIYSILPPGTISKVAACLPAGSKVGYFLREPVGRMASQMNLHYHLHGLFRGPAAASTVQAFLETGHQRRRSDYASNIENWSQVFGERFRAFIYDDLQDNPLAFLNAVAGHFGFDINQDIARETVKTVHGGSGDRAPRPNAAMKKQIAGSILPLVERFAEKMPQPGTKWLRMAEAQAAAEVPVKDVKQDVSPRVETLMRVCESLGDNCEYGFWQRHRGYEPSSLFRWAVTPIDSLLAYLEKPAPLFNVDNLTACSPGMVEDARFGFRFHSKLVERDEEGTLQILQDPAQFAEVYAAELQKWRHLEARFRTLLRKPGLFIVKRNKPLERGQVTSLAAQLHRRNPAHLVLWVEEGESHEIEELGGGILRAELPAFARYVRADQYHPEGWTRIMHSLLEIEPVEALMKRIHN